jgi:AraC-like DNA-binding protein
MKAFFEDIPSKKGDASFVAYAYSVPAFPFKWHYHPEYELTLITEGQGKRLVGDSHESFVPGDLVLIGPDMPHTWVSELQGREPSSAVVIQFSADFIAPFCQLPEFLQVKKILASSARGLYFSLPYAHALIQDLRHLPDLEPALRIPALLRILHTLCTQPCEPLSSPAFVPIRGAENERRFNVICQYVQTHAQEPLHAREAARILHLSESAFCKFFKRVSGKTFSDYVNDVRIGMACRLLLETELPIADIAFQCGFDNLSYFNRVFKSKKHCTPGQHRKR